MIPIDFQVTCSKSRSIHSFEPTVLSAHYLLNPSLDQYQTWWRGCPQSVDDPYWFSVHMFKGQGQTTLLNPTVLSAQYFFYPSTWSIPNLVKGLPSMSRWSLLIFESHDQRSRSNHSSQSHCVVCSIFFYPLHWSIPILVKGLPSICTVPATLTFTW